MPYNKIMFKLYIFNLYYIKFAIYGVKTPLITILENLKKQLSKKSLSFNI